MATARYHIGDRVFYRRSPADTGTVADATQSCDGRRWSYVIAWDHDDDRSSYAERSLTPVPAPRPVVDARHIVSDGLAERAGTGDHRAASQLLRAAELALTMIGVG